MKTYDIDLNGPSITCKLCGLTSWNLNDVQQKYCGHCHVFHEDVVSVEAYLLKRGIKTTMDELPQSLKPYQDESAP